MSIASPLNILCLVSYNFLPAKMGGQKGIASFYDFYARRTRITCVTTKSNDPSAADYEVLNILSDSPLRYANVFYFFTLRKLIRERQITHLQIEHPYYGWLAALLKWFCGVKLIVHSHNIEYQRFRSVGKPWWRLLYAYERWVHRRAQYNLFISDEDKEQAIEKFNLQPARCITATYGIEWSAVPPAAERAAARHYLQEQYGIAAEEYILLFNGSFHYKPNQDALRLLLDQISPLLQQYPDFKYRLVICGKNIPGDIAGKSYPSVVLAGFVDDISVYFKGADLFLNPVADGGGIKTKLVEALGYDLTAISYPNGAIGIPGRVTGDQLVITKDNDPADFAAAVHRAVLNAGHIPAAYFDYFYWDNIIQRVLRKITDSDT